MKRCPKCQDNKVIIFDSDNDWCPRCKKWFPAVMEEEDKCEVGCQHFTGGEIKHHKDCYFYPESRTEMYDNLKAENKIFKEALNNMYFAYVNKDEEFPHSFEIYAINESEELLKISNKLKDNPEREQPTTMEWYKAQVEELIDIRKAFYRICGDTADGSDAYFPDLVEKELNNMIEELSTSYKDIANLRIAIDKLKGDLSDANQREYDLKLKSIKQGELLKMKKPEGWYSPKLKEEKKKD